MAQRKIVQITALPVNLGSIGTSALIALCDDGTLWQTRTSGTWQRIDGPPQPEPIHHLEGHIPGIHDLKDEYEDC